MDKKIENVIIIGSGPAAHTAAIYAGRALLEPLVFEGEMAAGVAAGGQLTTTTDVENFPGFPKGIMGPELMMNMREQSINCGARIETKTVDAVHLSKKPFEVVVGSETYFAKTVIVSTGATAKRLGLPGEETYWQKGMSACAVCDGALPMFRNKPLVVIGGGDSACEEAHFLSKYASKVYLLVRRGEMRASKVMQERVKKTDKIEILWHTQATKVEGDGLMNAVHVHNSEDGTNRVLEANGLFYAIGHEPNTSFLNGQLECDSSGYIVTKPDCMATSVPGVYACGDVQDKTYRQAITAAGTGCMAALEAEQFLHL